MNTAIAIWNYCWKAEDVSSWIHEFADRGFDTISFHPNQFGGDSAGRLSEVVDTLQSRKLRATVHGCVSMDTQIMKNIVQAMGDRLSVFSLDSAMRQDTRGWQHDAKRIKAALSFLQELTQGTDIFLAVEDFPLDTHALQYFSKDLGEVYENPQTGILVDVGHMHMRMQGHDYFRGMTVADYFRGLPVRLVEVHLHDNNGERDQHAHFGFGSVPFTDIASALKQMHFGGVCTVEIAPAFHDRTPQDSKLDAIRSLEQWLKLMHSPAMPGANQSDAGDGSSRA